MRQTTLSPLSEAEYLDREATSPVRHEFVGGQAYAMAGASVAHNRIAGALYARLLSSAGARCPVFISDLKLRVDTSPTYYYPDVMVVCDPSDDDPLIKTRPCLIAEVLSPGTEAVDRREKLTAYQRLPSLREYLILSQQAPVIDLYRRRNLREWVLENLEGGDLLRVDCMPMEIPVADLYQDIVP